MSRLLVYISLIATLALGAHAEYKIGEFVGLDTELAYGLNLAMALPVAIDCYVLAALIAARDVPVALAVLAVSIGGGHVYIGAAEDDVAKAVTGGAVGLLLVAVLWRVEELAKHDAGVRAAAAEKRRQEEEQRREAARQAQLAHQGTSPEATSPATGEAPTPVPWAGGTPPAVPPRGRATTTRPAARQGSGTPAGRTKAASGKVSREEAAEDYVTSQLDDGRTPTAAGMLAEMRSRSGSGMRDEALRALLRELVEKHSGMTAGAAPGGHPVPLRAVNGSIPEALREEAPA